MKNDFILYRQDGSYISQDYHKDAYGEESPQCANNHGMFRAVDQVVVSGHTTNLGYSTAGLYELPKSVEVVIKDYTTQTERR